MSYKDELSRIIKESKLSLREIASRCQALGISISHSYISQLQRGRLSPPKEEISIAICQVCNVNPENLLIYGYYDNSPELIKQYVDSCSKTNLKIALLLNERSKDKIDISFIKDMELIERLNFTISRGWKFQQQFKGYNDITQYAFETETPNTSTAIYMKDDSMQPSIPKDSLLKIDNYREYKNKKKEIIHKPKNGDIIIFNFNDEFELVRRYQEINDSIFLKPDNNKFNIMQISGLEDIFIIGKVVAYSKGVN